MARSAIVGIDKRNARPEAIAKAFVAAVERHADLSDELIPSTCDAFAELRQFANTCLAGFFFGLESRPGLIELRASLGEHCLFLRDRLLKELELIFMLLEVAPRRFDIALERTQIADIRRLPGARARPAERFAALLELFGSTIAQRFGLFELASLCIEERF